VESRFRFRVLARIIALLIVGFLGAQFIRPELANPRVTAELQTPAEVKRILKKSCYNCHSNETQLSWFDKPVPAYWIVLKHVREGRKHLNFSDIGALPAAQQNGALFESVSQIELGAMPLPAYEKLHPESTVTPEELAVLKNYLNSLVIKGPSSAAEIDAANADYEKWIQSGGSPAANVAPAPNGIAFQPEYKNWKAISSTERADNRSTRVILGNDIAVQAITDNKINPWPDGTEFAKVAWMQQVDDKGVVRDGKFFQVEFMIRDSQKYAKTLGWGWARWRGADLKPYGKDANFADECVGCHTPLANTNYVFTMPIGGQR